MFDWILVGQDNLLSQIVEDTPPPASVKTNIDNSSLVPPHTRIDEGLLAKLQASVQE